MTPPPKDQFDEDAADLLARSRPAIGEAWADETEVQLFGRRPRPTRSRVVAGAFGFSSAGAAALVVASLLGAGPLALHGQDDANATQDCRIQTVTTTRPASQLVRGHGGQPEVVTRTVTSTTPVRVCR